MKLLNILSFYFFLLTPFLVKGQEICDNGIDDDGDELIDLNDLLDCTCESNNLVFFENFENYSCCPSSYTNGGGMGIECLIGMQNASEATPDYLNTCGFIGIPGMPLPPPSGNGAAGIISVVNWAETIGTCLPTPLNAGTTYEFSFFIGFNNANQSISPVTMAIYGTSDCANLPANVETCILNDVNWFFLGNVEVTGLFNSWSFASGSFIAPQSVSAIAIGADCNWLGSQTYHFIDDVKISEISDNPLVIDTEIIETGDCINGNVLSNSGLSGSTYQWYLDGIAISGATNLDYEIPIGAEGTYILRIMKDGLCAQTDPYIFVQELEVIDLTGTVNDVLCFGQQNGSIVLDLPQINDPFDIVWSNGDNAATITGLGPGEYSVTLTDDNDCFGSTTFTVIEPLFPLEIIVIFMDQPTIQNPFGSIEIDIVGGTPSYQIFWSNGSSEYTVTGLLPGNHSVTVIDANGCTITSEFIIYAPLSADIMGEDEACLLCDGTAEVFASGGKAPYSYIWSNDETSKKITNLCDGTYLVTITDQNSVVTVQSVTILNYAPMQLSAIDLDLFNCPNDPSSIISLNISSGIPAYEIEWSNGLSSSTIESLDAGTYTVTITDKKGCMLDSAFVVVQSDSLVWNAQVTNLTCTSLGSINVTPQGGILPLEIQWNTGADSFVIDSLAQGSYTAWITDSIGCSDSMTYVVQSVTPFSVLQKVEHVSCEENKDGKIELEIQNGSGISILWNDGNTSSKRDSLAIGNYSVQIRDGSGCIQSLVLAINAKTNMSLDTVVNHLLCNGDVTGSIQATIANGNAPYNFLWNTGDENSYIDSLNAGIYSLQVTDSLNCKKQFAFEIKEPPALNLSIVTFAPKCNVTDDGQIILNGIGGTLPYVLKVNNAFAVDTLKNLNQGTYDVKLIDKHLCTYSEIVTLSSTSNIEVQSNITNAGCDDQAIGAINLDVAGGVGNYEYKWNTGQEEADIQSLGSGEYTVTITDDLMCTLVDTFQILSQGSLNAVATHEDILCYGETNGAIQINATSLNPPLTYNLNGNVISNNQISNLGPSTYEIKVIDAIGCEWTEEITIEENSELIASIDNVNHPPVGQQYGSATVSALGGTSPYTIMWDNGEATTTATQLLGGMHEVTVTDFHGCSRVLTLVIESSINVNFLAKENACFEECKGELTIVVVPDDAELRYEWSDGGQGKTRTDFCNGVYSCKVYKDQVLIAEVRDMIITSPPAINIVPMIIDASCIGRGDGGITLQVEGGTSAYAYSWGNASTQRSIANLKAGKYQVTITDAKQCSKIAEYEVGEPAGISIDVKSTDVFCEELGTIELKTLASEDVEVKVNSIAYTVAKEITITQLTKGRYNLEYILNSNCNIKMDDVVITETPFIIEGLEQLNIDVKKGSTVQYNLTNAKVQGDFDVRWKAANPVKCLQTDPLGPCLMLEITALLDDDMIIEIYNEEGCIEDYVIEIRVNEEVEVLIPNIFSPSNDEAFKPFSNQNVMIRSMMIYDRWGNVVYQESNKLIAELTGWNGLFNGKVAVDGVYVYHIEYEEEGGKQVVRMGDVTMVR